MPNLAATQKRHTRSEPHLVTAVYLHNVYHILLKRHTLSSWHVQIVC